MRYLVSIIFKLSEFPDINNTDWLDNILECINDEVKEKHVSIEILHGTCDRIDCPQEAVEISVNPMTQAGSVYDITAIQEFGEIVARTIAKNLPVSKNTRKVVLKNYLFYSLFSVCV